MKMKMSLSKIALALGVAATLASASQASLAADTRAFVVGVTIPKSGPAAQFGPLVESGMVVAIKHINEEGGILGRKVELLVRDSASNPQRAVLAAKELVEEQKVDYLFPEIVSGLALAVLPYTTERKVLTITNASAPKIGDAKEFPYSFQYGDLASKRAPAMASAMKKLGGKRVGILVSTNPGNIATGEQLQAELPSKFGMQVAGYRTYDGNAKDLTAQLQALRDAGADIIAFDAAIRDSIRAVMTSIQTLGWNVQVVCGVAPLSGDLKELVPASVASQFRAINYRVGTRTGPSRPEFQQFVAELRKAGPISNIAFPAIARDILYMVKYSYDKAAKEKGGATADNVKAVLESIGSAKDFPARYSLVLGNPRWTPADHTAANVDYSKLWGLVRVSTPVDGVYEGEELVAE
jgi:branched-chain amino acid transport system substrate-binding protein